MGTKTTATATVTTMTLTVTTATATFTTTTLSTTATVTKTTTTVTVTTTTMTMTTTTVSTSTTRATTTDYEESVVHCVFHSTCAPGGCVDLDTAQFVGESGCSPDSVCACVVESPSATTTATTE